MLKEYSVNKQKQKNDQQYLSQTRNKTLAKFNSWGYLD